MFSNTMGPRDLDMNQVGIDLPVHNCINSMPVHTDDLTIHVILYNAQYHTLA